MQRSYDFFMTAGVCTICDCMRITPQQVHRARYNAVDAYFITARPFFWGIAQVFSPEILA